MEHDFGPLPTEHPRAEVARSAKIEFERMVMEWEMQYGVTPCEYVMILGDHLHQRGAALVRTERRRSDS